MDFNIRVHGWITFPSICDILNITLCFRQTFTTFMQKSHKYKKLLCRNSEISFEDFPNLSMASSHFHIFGALFLVLQTKLLSPPKVPILSLYFIHWFRSSFPLWFSLPESERARPCFSTNVTLEKMFLLCYICHTVAIIQLRFQRIEQILSSFSLSLLLFFLF